MDIRLAHLFIDLEPIGSDHVYHSYYTLYGYVSVRDVMLEAAGARVRAPQAAILHPLCGGRRRRRHGRHYW